MNNSPIGHTLVCALGVFVLSTMSLGHDAPLLGPEMASAAEIQLLVDGKPIATDVAPTIIDGRTLVPVRAVSESLQAQVAWHDDLRIVSVAKQNMVLTLQADKKEYQMNGRIHTLDVPLQIIDGRAMVPIRVISEAFGADVEWDGDAQRVLISMAGADVASTTSDQVLQQYGSIRIKHNRVNIRQAPNTSSPIVSQANEGDIFSLTGRVNDWFQIRRSDGTTAYVAGWLADVYDPSRSFAQVDPVTPAPEPAPVPAPMPTPSPEPPPVSNPTPAAPEATTDLAGQKHVSLFNNVNLRSGPSTSFDKVGQVNRGAEFTAIREENGWLLLNWQGKEVWVRNDLVSSDLSLIKTPTTLTSGHVNAEAAETMQVLETKEEHGQSWVTFHVGQAKTRVVSNTKETIVLEVDGAQVPAGFADPMAGKRPFVSMAFENVSDYAVRITVTLEKGGYFRLDRDNERFSIMGVAKHKDGNVGLAGKTIVLDPGHGNYSGGTVDPGAISKHNGLKETDFNTNVMMYLKETLEAQGAKVIMTRGYEPCSITLAQRAYLANDNSADAFVSLHGDSASNSSAYGAGTWLYTGDLRLTSAAQKDVRNELAKSINSGIAQATGRPAYIKYANFAVTRENEVPSVLVEAGFLSNPTDAALLATEDYQRKIAQGLYDGLANFFSY